MSLSTEGNRYWPRLEGVPQGLPVTQNGIPDMRYNECKEWVWAQAEGVKYGRIELPGWVPRKADGHLDEGKAVARPFIKALQYKEKSCFGRCFGLCGGTEPRSVPPSTYHDGYGPIPARPREFHSPSAPTQQPPPVIIIQNTPAPPPPPPVQVPQQHQTLHQQQKCPRLTAKGLPDMRTREGQDFVADQARIYGNNYPTWLPRKSNGDLDSLEACVRAYLKALYIQPGGRNKKVYNVQVTQNTGQTRPTPIQASALAPEERVMIAKDTQKYGSSRLSRNKNDAHDLQNPVNALSFQFPKPRVNNTSTIPPPQTPEVYTQPPPPPPQVPSAPTQTLVAPRGLQTTPKDIKFTVAGAPDMRTKIAKDFVAAAAQIHGHDYPVWLPRKNGVPDQSKPSVQTYFGALKSMTQNPTESPPLPQVLQEVQPTTTPPKKGQMSSPNQDRSPREKLPSRMVSIPPKIKVTAQGLPDMRTKAARDFVVVQARIHGANPPPWVPRRDDGSIDIDKPAGGAYFAEVAKNSQYL